MDMLDRDCSGANEIPCPPWRGDRRRDHRGSTADSQTVLFHNRGDGTFEEIAAYAGVTASDWAWQGCLHDVDLDGYEDMIIPAGFAHDVNDMDAMEEGRALRRAGKLVPPKLGSDGKPVARSPQEERDEENYRSIYADRTL